MDVSSHPIQSCEWLFLQTLEDQPDNTLRIVVLEARAGALADATALAQSEGRPELESLLEGARRIEHSEDCRVFEFFWPSYVAYSVRNESYATAAAHEISEGRVFLRYSKSRFLDYIAVGTFADNDFPGPLTHWGLSCSEHIIDVASIEPPTVRSMNK